MLSMVVFTNTAVSQVAVVASRLSHVRIYREH